MRPFLVSSFAAARASSSTTTPKTTIAIEGMPQVTSVDAVFMVAFVVVELLKSKVMARRGYSQFCGLAKCLDRIGERWSLLVVRNLLLGPSTYTALIEGLPGITTNLLAKRLREMESMGLIERDGDRKGARYRLTPMGAALEPAIVELGRWGSRFLARPEKNDRFDVRWAMVSLKRRYQGGTSVTVELHCGGRVFELKGHKKRLSVLERAAAMPAVTVALELATVGLVFGGGASVRALERKGQLTLEGDGAGFERFVAAFGPG
jgi:DNA-binding HxlR family transcriptional regulator